MASAKKGRGAASGTPTIPGMFMTPSLWGDRCHVKICSGNPGAGAWLSLAKRIGSLKLILALGFKYLSLNLNSHHSRSTVRTKWSCLAFNTKWSHLTPINLSGLLCHSRFTTKTGIQTFVGGTVKPDMQKDYFCPGT